MAAVLVALLTCAATAAAQGPDVSVSNLSGASIFNGAQPETSSSTDPNAVELGLRFESSVPVAIEGIRFFKGQGDTGTHVGHLWSTTGTLLASATFTEETAYGWQSVKFAKPVVIEPHTVYVASYYAPRRRLRVHPLLLRKRALRERPHHGSAGSERRLQIWIDERIPDRNV